MPTDDHSERRFRDRSELLDFLLEVSTVASSTLDLDSLLAALGELIRRAVPCELFAILLYSERRRGLRVRYSLGYSPEMLKDLVIPLNEGLTGVAASTRAPVICGDVRNDPRYLGLIDAVRSEMAIPMLLRGRLVGVIDLQTTRRNAFSSEDSALVQLIASRATSSIVNARLYRRVERQNRTLRALSRVSQEFSRILDLDELLGKIAATVKGLIDFTAFTVYLHDDDAQLLRARFNLRYDREVEPADLPLTRGVAGAAATTRRPVRVEDTREDPRCADPPSGIRSKISIPLIVPGHLIGVMNLESTRVAFFTEDHQQTLLLLAPLVARAIDNARLYSEVAANKERMEADLEAARRLQTFLLPKSDPEIAGLEIGIGFRPAHEISGDVFDFFEQSDSAIISIGDVSGKSAAAALYGAMVTGLLRTLAPRRRRPAALMASINEALLERKAEGKYLTLLVARWQPASGLLTMANAAAIPPLILRRGAFLEPHLEGFPLGLFPGSQYEEFPFQTEPGDVILLYSDGIQDQHNHSREEYGAHRLREFLPQLAGLPAQQIVDEIFADFDRFRGEREAFDDQTLIAIRILAQP